MHASLNTVTARDAEVAELNRKLEVANADLDHINRRFYETQGMQIFI